MKHDCPGIRRSVAKVPMHGSSWRRGGISKRIVECIGGVDEVSIAATTAGLLNNDRITICADRSHRVDRSHAYIELTREREDVIHLRTTILRTVAEIPLDGGTRICRSEELERAGCERILNR